MFSMEKMGKYDTTLVHQAFCDLFHFIVSYADEPTIREDADDLPEEQFSEVTVS